jgi:hypothetical protein
VAPAPELDVLLGSFATGRVGADVMELQEAALAAATAALSDERASPEVAAPYRAPDFGRDVA